MCEARNIRLYRHRRWNFRGTGINSVDAQICGGRGMHLKTYSESHGCEVFRVTSVCHHGHVRVMRRGVW